MKFKNAALLLLLGSISAILILFSPVARQGAEEGLVLSQHTIIPSLLPLLIIFLMIMKSGAKDIIARLFGRAVSIAFNLPFVSAPAIIFGMLGGFPTGALLTSELYEAGELSQSQARRLMSFNFCGGCGFIITAVGTARLNNHMAGVLLFASNTLATLAVGFALSFKEKRSKESFYSFTPENKVTDIINSATSSAVASVLNISAIIILFSSLLKIVNINGYALPLLEITTGICAGEAVPLPLMSAYLSFGGLCIHLQLLGTMKRVGLRYPEFLICRVLSAGLSYCIMKLLLIIFPEAICVFSNTAQTVQLTSVNYALSVLMIIGCFVIILDIKSKKIKV